MAAHLEFAQHIHQLSQMIQVGHLHKIQPYILQQTTDMQKDLAEWLGTILPDVSIMTDSKNIKLNLNQKGWQAYYQHRYLDAFNYFKTAFYCDDNTLNRQAALGLCKVYTRTGHWHTARSWCLYYLQQSRLEGNHFDIAKGYGALAEIFLRANQAQAALACFQLAYHLMPLGQGQQARQFNFMASALIRNQEYDRAETLLLTSRQMSRNAMKYLNEQGQDYVSFLHSNARFAYLHMMQSGKYAHALKDEFVAQNMKGAKVPTGATAVPFGHMRMAYGMSLLMNQSSNSTQQFQLAAASYTENIPMEYHWAKRLEAASQGEYYPPSDQLTTLLSLEQCIAPELNSICDMTWLNLAISNAGFSPLIDLDLSIEQLVKLWTLFFI